MISDYAYQQIKDSFMRDRLDDGAFALALTLYQNNFEKLKRDGKTDQEAENTLLTDITLESFKNLSGPLFKENARKITKLDRAKATFGAALYNIAIGIVGNVVFVILSLIVVFAMKDTAKNFLKSFDDQQTEVRSEAKPENRLPPNPQQ